MTELERQLREALRACVDGWKKGENVVGSMRAAERLLAQEPNAATEILKLLGMPKHCFSFSLFAKPSEAMTCHAEWYPSDPATGHPMLDKHLDGILRRLGAEFVLVDKQTFYELPKDYQIALLAKARA